MPNQSKWTLNKNRFLLVYEFHRRKSTYKMAASLPFSLFSVLFLVLWKIFPAPSEDAGPSASWTENGSCVWAGLSAQWHIALCWCGVALSLLPLGPVVKKPLTDERSVWIRLSRCFPPCWTKLTTLHPQTPCHLCPPVPRPPVPQWVNAARGRGGHFSIFEFEMPVELVQSTVTLLGGPCICV